MFTLAHEMAHVWLGETGLSDVEPVWSPTNRIEQWCNQVAAEFLVPLTALHREYQAANDLTDEVARLARCFKVSTLVILRRIHDAGHLTQDELWTAYHAELERLLAIPRGTGGNFYLTQAARVSKRFARALVATRLRVRLCTAMLSVYLASRSSHLPGTRSQSGGRLMPYLLDSDVFIQAKNLHYGLTSARASGIG